MAGDCLSLRGRNAANQNHKSEIRLAELRRHWLSVWATVFLLCRVTIWDAVGSQSIHFQKVHTGNQRGLRGGLGLGPGRSRSLFVSSLPHLCGLLVLLLQVRQDASEQSHLACDRKLKKNWPKGLTQSMTLLSTTKRTIYQIVQNLSAATRPTDLNATVGVSA